MSSPAQTDGLATAPRRPRPAVNRDNAFFFDGAHEGELRIQQCADCGTLRHPPSPMCPQCNSRNRTWIVASGAGEIYSYVVHHHPPVAGFRSPFVVVLVELAEGPRVVGNLLNGPDASFSIGDAVELTFAADPGDDLVLPHWKLAATGNGR